MDNGLKKVAHLTFHMRTGGAEKVICSLVENLDPRKFTSSVLCLDHPVGHFAKLLMRQGYEVKTLGRKPGFDFSLVLKIRRHIAEHGIDVLHCHQYTPYVYGVLGAAFTPCRVIFTEHGRFYPDRRKVKRVLVNPLLAFITDHITAISSATADALSRYENFPKGRIGIVYNGIDGSPYRGRGDSRLLASLGIGEGARVLGTVARLDPIKNQTMMIKALGLVHRYYPETYLLLVGDGPESESLKAFAAGRNLSSRVIFTGFREDTHRYYRCMDLFLLTSFSEGTAMTLLEAMASGLTSVVTEVGGNPEVVRDGETGFFVASDDETALAEKICRVLGDDDLRQRFGRNASLRFERCYSIEKMVSAYETIYYGKRRSLDL